jgi:hypothetical protein
MNGLLYLTQKENPILPAGLLFLTSREKETRGRSRTSLVLLM